MLDTNCGFSCKCCGDCCSGDMDIFINLYDIYKMAKHLNYTNSRSLFDNGYLSLELGQNSVVVAKVRRSKKKLRGASASKEASPQSEDRLF